MSSKTHTIVYFQTTCVYAIMLEGDVRESVDDFWRECRTHDIYPVDIVQGREATDALSFKVVEGWLDEEWGVWFDDAEPDEPANIVQVKLYHSEGLD